MCAHHKRLPLCAQVYTQMSQILGKVFFPSRKPALQALSFWGVFLAGFVARPLGAGAPVKPQHLLSWCRRRAMHAIQYKLQAC